MTRGETLERYSGEMLGPSCLLGLPLLTMRICVFAFPILFQRRLSGSNGLPGYAVFVVAGLAPWTARRNVLGRRRTAIFSNANLVKQIDFPNEILSLLAALGVLSTLVIGPVVGMPAPIGGLGGSSTAPLLIVAVACYLVMMAGLV